VRRSAMQPLAHIPSPHIEPARIDGALHTNKTLPIFRNGLTQATFKTVFAGSRADARRTRPFVPYPPIELALNDRNHNHPVVTSPKASAGPDSFRRGSGTTGLSTELYTLDAEVHRYDGKFPGSGRLVPQRHFSSLLQRALGACFLGKPIGGVGAKGEKSARREVMHSAAHRIWG